MGWGARRSAVDFLGVFRGLHSICGGGPAADWGLLEIRAIFHGKWLGVFSLQRKVGSGEDDLPRAPTAFFGDESRRGLCQAIRPVRGRASRLSGKTVSARAVGLASKSSRARPSRRFGGRWWGPGLSPPEYFGLVEIGWAEAGPVGDDAAAFDGASCEEGGGGDAVVIIPGAGPRLPLTSTVRPNSVTATITMFCNTWGRARARRRRGCRRGR